MRKRIWIYLYFISFGLLICTVPVRAYIDPSVMTYAIQAISGIAIALGAFLGIYWRRLRKKIVKDFHLEERSKKNHESDALYFIDPETGVKQETHVKEGTASAENIQQVKQKRDILSGLILATVTAFIVAIHSPLELYFSNPLEFWFDYQTMLPYCGKMFVVLFCVLLAVYLIAYLLYDKFYHVVFATNFIVLVFAFIQGNFYTGNMPATDGRAIDWSIYGHEDLKSLLTLFAILAIVVLLIRFFSMKNMMKLSRYVCVLLMLLSVVLMIVTGKANNGFADKSLYMYTYRNMFNVSPDKNVVVIVLDATDGKYFKEVLNDPQYTYREDFADFTSYPDMLGKYSFTAEAIPFMISGKEISGQNVDYTEFNGHAVQESPMLNYLKKENYQIDLYDPDIPLKDPENAGVNNVTTDFTFSSFRAFASASLRFTEYYYLPYYFKKFVPVSMDAFNIAQAKDGAPAVNYANVVFKQALIDSPAMTTDMSQPNFKWIHIEGGHVPFNMDENANPIENGTYEQKLASGLTLANEYIQRLKDAGVYDDTAIVVMADHGYNFDDYHGRTNPMFIAKGFNEHHPFQENLAPVSYDDLQTAIPRLADGSKGSEIFDTVQGEHRTRTFFEYPYLHEDDMTKLTLDGPAWDYSLMQDTGEKYGFKK